MPLSEHEQRLLEEMERNLYQNDADFVAKVGGRRSKPSYRSIVLGILIGVLGVACLLVGVFSQVAIIGILGFVIMLAGVLLAIAPSRSTAPPAAGRSGSAQRARAAQPGFMDKLNERWDKRQDGEH